MIGQKNVRSFVKGILFLSPAIVLLLIFMVYPIFRTMDMSFYTSYNYFKDEVYERGLGNYRYLLEDQEFQTALKNTVVYVLGVMPASILLSLLLAILLNSKIRFKALFQTIYFLPFVTSTVAIAIVWRWIYNSEYGILNSVLKLFGVDPIKWLLDPHWTMLSLIILGIWKSLDSILSSFLLAYRTWMSNTTRRPALTEPPPFSGCGGSRCRCCRPRFFLCASSPSSTPSRPSIRSMLCSARAPDR